MARVEFSPLELAENAVKSGQSDVLFELGRMYSTGREVEPDLITAHKWFNLAAMKGNKDALQYRMEIAQEMTKAEIAEAQRMAREFLRQN